MNAINSYLQNLPSQHARCLEHIRKLIHSIVPDLEETISYGIPTFKYKGKNLVHIAAFKHHMSIYPGARPIHLLADKLSGFTTSKGTVQFTLEHPLSDALIIKLVQLARDTIDQA